MYFIIVLCKFAIRKVRFAGRFTLYCFVRSNLQYSIKVLFFSLLSIWLDRDNDSFSLSDCWLDFLCRLPWYQINTSTRLHYLTYSLLWITNRKRRSWLVSLSSTSLPIYTIAGCELFLIALVAGRLRISAKALNLIALLAVFLSYFPWVLYAY